jgi:hypothetical protein
MRALTVLAGLASLAIATAGHAAAAAPAGGTVHFQVFDEMDRQEVSEDTVIFINGRLVAHFKLDKGNPAVTADVEIEAAKTYDYALCGRITIARPDGTTEQHVVDGGGTVPEVAGRTFLALAASDFTIFYLLDSQSKSPMPPEGVHRSNACSLPVA